MPLETRFRAWLYGCLALLFVTGAAWFAIDALREQPGAAAATTTLLLMIHGGAAMAMLLLLGALGAVHVVPSWRRGRNRASGAMAFALNIVLILTAFALYYVGSERWRAGASALHIGVGLALPFLLALHVVLGKRAAARGTRTAHRHRSASDRLFGSGDLLSPDAWVSTGGSFSRSAAPRS
jgi:hypothetical protein